MLKIGYFLSLKGREVSFKILKFFLFFILID